MDWGIASITILFLLGVLTLVILTNGLRRIFPNWFSPREENEYMALRNMALTAKHTQLGLELPTDKTVVYGVVMDWQMGAGTATVAAFQTGDASMYLSGGGGVIGGGQHEKVSFAATHFVSAAQLFLSKAQQTNQTSLPASDEIIFYLLTNSGTYAAKEQTQNFENGTSLWMSLFNEGNNVISALRQITDNK